MQAECKEVIVAAYVECVFYTFILFTIVYVVAQLLSWLFSRFIDRKSKA